MKISYKKLWLMLVEKEISQATLRKDLNIATGTMTKLRRNEEVALSVLLRICEYLDCNHIKEKNCGIKKALSEGKISKQRYERYCKIFEELKDKEEHKW